MPDNSMGSDPDIPAPRGDQLPDPDFEMMRAMDGRRSPSNPESPDPDEARNAHDPKGYSLVEVLLVCFLLLVILVVLFRLL